MTAPTAPSDPSAQPAWVDSELSNPHASAEKASKVRRMFSAIAGSYDLNNRVHSLGRDQAWRRFAVRRAAVAQGDAVLDVACGTGDLSQAFAATHASSVVGLDFTPAMLDHARTKQKALVAATGSKLTYVEGDAQHLPFADASFAEFFRVLKPGGRLIVLEFDRPSFAPFRWLNDLYCGWIMPRTATLISGDTSGAYRYLPASVGTFMSRQAMCDSMRGVGFTQVEASSLTLGICACYRGLKA
jgi:demethylmenaquinone methyltransferase / 2-methoxy-6-polyprenyl-1,4-benzoquinol methylase